MTTVDGPLNSSDSTKVRVTRLHDRATRNDAVSMGAEEDVSVLLDGHLAAKRGWCARGKKTSAPIYSPEEAGESKPKLLANNSATGRLALLVIWLLRGRLRKAFSPPHEREVSRMCHR